MIAWSLGIRRGETRKDSPIDLVKKGRGSTNLQMNIRKRQSTVEPTMGANMRTDRLAECTGATF
jgi:hypothetical protein